MAAARAGRIVGKREVLAVARELFPEEMTLADAAAADRGHLRELARAMTALGGPQEADEKPVEQAALPLPGAPPPKFITAPDDEGELGIVEWLDARRPSRVWAIRERREMASAINERAIDLERKEEALKPFCRSDDTTPREALAVMALEPAE